MRASAATAPAGFTLIEFTIVIALLGVMMLVAAPNFFAGNRGDPGTREQMSLWLQLIAEHSSLRGQVVLLEVDPEEQQLRAVRPSKSAEIDVDADTGGEAVTLVEIDNAYVPAVFELTEDLTFQDVEDAGGVKYTDEKFFVVVYPYGWIDPVTFHLRDQEGSWTGVVNGITGQIHWQAGYFERLREEDVF